MKRDFFFAEINEYIKHEKQNFAKINKYFEILNMKKFRENFFFVKINEYFQISKMKKFRKIFFSR